MDNTCKNCAYAETLYIWSDNDISVICGYHNKREIKAHACDKWKARDMTANSVPIENKEFSKLPDGGVEIKCKFAAGERPDWFKNMFGDNDEEKTYDPVNSPKHYTSRKVECIDAMIETFGVEAVKHFCLCNAFKYHWRHELKNGDEDIKKATWYMNKYKELENR